MPPDARQMRRPRFAQPPALNTLLDQVIAWSAALASVRDAAGARDYLATA